MARASWSQRAKNKAEAEMTAFDGLRDYEPAAPRPWLATRRLIDCILFLVTVGAWSLLLVAGVVLVMGGD